MTLGKRQRHRTVAGYKAFPQMLTATFFQSQTKAPSCRTIDGAGKSEIEKLMNCFERSSNTKCLPRDWSGRKRKETRGQEVGRKSLLKHKPILAAKFSPGG